MAKLLDKAFYAGLGERLGRFGLGKSLVYWADRLANKLIHFERLRIIVLNRDEVRPPRGLDDGKFSSRFATREDLVALQREGTWAIDAANLADFDAGDRCLLSYVDGKLAGYTWVHTRGEPVLMPGLKISIPSEYVYNFAAFTSPDFRGAGVQGYRHYALINHPDFRDKRGLLGYVKYTNWSSRQGQSKSGYRAIGTLWLLGGKRRFYVGVPRSLRAAGIRRLPNEPSTTGTLLRQR